MKLQRWKHFFYFSIILFFSAVFSLNAQEVAFPGAQGWASTITGGRGGQIIRVTNLNASGAGSFKAAIDTPGPRIIVFEVGGVIDISSLNYSKIMINHGNVTIAGQTAPPPGITIVGGFIQSYADNIIMQHIRIRPGADGRSTGWQPDCFSSQSSNIILDHCSFSWSVDENIGIWSSTSTFDGSTPDEWRANSPHNITVSNCIISEGFNFSTNPKDYAHSMGLLAGDNSTNIAVVDNLFHSNGRRNPLFKGGTRGVVINNYIYNPGDWAISYVMNPNIWGSYPMQYTYMTVIGNFMQYGPSSDLNTEMVNTAPSYADGGRAKIYMRDNVGKTQSGANVKQYSGDPAHLVSSIPTWHSSFDPVPASAVRQRIVENAGARPWDRDPIDKRIINEMLSNGSKGAIINSESEVEGLPRYSQTYAPFIASEWDLKYMIRKSTTNSSPVLSSIGNKSVNEGSIINVQLNASDANGDAMTYSLSPNLAFVTLSDNRNGTGSLKLAPVTGQSGSYNLTIKVTDSKGASDSETIVISVLKNTINAAPELSAIGPKTLSEGEVMDVNITASDADGDKLSFTITQDFPFLTFKDNGNGTASLRLAPVSGNAGSYLTTIKVHDEKGADDYETIRITVEQGVPANTAPVLATIGNKTITEGEVRNITLTANDADGDIISFAVSPILPFSTLTDNDDGTANLRLAPASGHAGTYNLTVTVKDIEGASDSETIQITVNAPVNAAPELSAIGAKTLREGEVMDVIITASDADGDKLSFTITQDFPFLTFKDNGNGTASLRLTPVSGNAGSYLTTIKVHDEKGAYDYETIRITIEQGAPSNSAPVLSTIGNKVVSEGNVMNVQLSATDADGDMMNYAISPSYPFVTLTDLQDGTGRIRLEPVAGQAGNYPLTITVVDEKGANDSETITITVKQAVAENSAPVLASIGSQTLSENEVLNIPLSSSDADGDPMHYTVSPDLKFSKFTFKQDGSGLLTLSPKPGDAGTYSLKITVLDNKNANDSETITVNVEPKVNANSAPKLNPVGSIKVKNGKKFETQVSASDVDGDQLVYSSSPDLPFARLSDNGDGTAKLTIYPDEADVGQYEIVITVTDANNAKDSEIISLTVEQEKAFSTGPSIDFVTGVNSGGTAYSMGDAGLLQDQYYEGGFVYDIESPIAGTDHDAIYQTERFGELTYEIPVTEYGRYTVRLHFAELYFINGEKGARVFNVDIENGQASLVNYDINADVGPLTAAVKTFSGIKVYDGRLTVELKQVVNNPKISAIEIFSEGEQDIIAGIEPGEQDESLTVYPNPTNGICTVEIPENNQGGFGDLLYTVYDLAGKVVEQSNIDQPFIQLDLSGKRKGIYVLKVGNYLSKKIFLK